MTEARVAQLLHRKPRERVGKWHCRLPHGHGASSWHTGGLVGGAMAKAAALAGSMGCRAGAMGEGIE